MAYILKKRLFTRDFFCKKENSLNFFYKTESINPRRTGSVHISFKKTNSKINKIIFEIFEANNYEKKVVFDEDFSIELKDIKLPTTIYFFFNYFTVLHADEEIGELSIVEEESI